MLLNNSRLLVHLQPDEGDFEKTGSPQQIDHLGEIPVRQRLVGAQKNGLALVAVSLGEKRGRKLLARDRMSPSARLWSALMVRNIGLSGRFCGSVVRPGRLT